MMGRKLVDEAARRDRVIGIRPDGGLGAAVAVRISPGAIPGVVIVNAEGITTDDGNVISLARVHLGVELRGQAVGHGQSIDVGRVGIADDLLVAAVLENDEEDMFVARQRIRARRGARTTGSCDRKCRDGTYEHSHPQAP
jgi:hypothetical protein